MRSVISSTSFALFCDGLWVSPVFIILLLSSCTLVSLSSVCAWAAIWWLLKHRARCWTIFFVPIRLRCYLVLLITSHAFSFIVLNQIMALQSYITIFACLSIVLLIVYLLARHLWLSSVSVAWTILVLTYCVIQLVYGKLVADLAFVIVTFHVELLFLAIVVLFDRCLLRSLLNMLLSFLELLEHVCFFSLEILVLLCLDHVFYHIILSSAISTICWFQIVRHSIDGLTTFAFPLVFSHRFWFRRFDCILVLLWLLPIFILYFLWNLLNGL